MGDWNATVQAGIDDNAAQVLGPHTFDRSTLATPHGNDKVDDSRTRFLNFAIDNNMVAANTWFEKPDDTKSHTSCHASNARTPWDQGKI